MMSVGSRSRPEKSVDFSVSLPDSGSEEGELRGLSVCSDGGDGLALSSGGKTVPSRFGDRSVLSVEDGNPAVWAAKKGRPNNPL